MIGAVIEIVIVIEIESDSFAVAEKSITIKA